MTRPDPQERSPILEVDDLVVEYAQRRRGRRARVLHGVSFDIGWGETMGLVGESGSGKTTIGRAVLGLTPVCAGTIRFAGEDISETSRRRRGSRIHIQAIFQDPYTSLNPMMSVGETLAEPLRARGLSRRDAMARVTELLDRVRMPADSARRLPRDFSGGQRQRIAIARALALEPRLIVCDEPVSALDLSTQATVLELLIEIQEETGVAYLFISHDLAVVRAISHRVCVLLRGEIVEQGDAAVVTAAPTHPYTQRLCAASPVPDPVRQAERRRLFEAMPAVSFPTSDESR